ncbi:MAG TPA: helix-turn-helix domain-containing protein [Jatrophihabitans sp.]|nr:helix-turn-helix domain-containing protein [Jatrophihabitans sp.]
MTHVDVSASRPLRKDAARNRALLIQAARTVFAERGLEASLDDVAREAGLGVGTAYRHFANKYELAQAVFAEAIENVLDLAERCAAAEDPWQGIAAFLEGIAELQSADRGLREVLMGFHDPERLERTSDRLSAPLNQMVERAKQAGAVRPDIEATDLGVVVLMLCTVADVTGDAAPDLWRRYLPMLLDGLRAGSDLPVPPVSEDVLRKAMSSHKQQLARAYDH